MRDFKDEMKVFKDEMLDFKDEMKMFKDEMLDFKDEMRDFKDEMKVFKDEMLDFKDEMKMFKDEMLDFKDEMRDFKDEMKVFKDEINKKWSDMAIKMGTEAEDIVAPGIPYAIRRYFGLEVEDLMVRRRKKLPDGRVREYDVIAVAGGYVFVVEVKTKFKSHHIEEVLSLVEDFFDFFPEFEERSLMGMIASFYLSEDLINLASKNRLLAVRMGGEYLEILNADKCPIGAC